MLDHPPLLPVPEVPTNTLDRDRHLRVRIADEMEAKEKQLGISYVAPTREAFQALETSPGHRQPSFTDYQRAAQSVLTQYGITLSLSPTSQGTLWNGGITTHTPTAAQLETEIAKNEATEVMSFFSRVPRQLVALTPELKDVYFTANGSDSAIGKFAGEAISTTRTMDIDVVNNTESNNETVPHEFTHFLMAHICGSFDVADPGYEALNKHALYAGKWPLPKGFLRTQPPSFDKVEDSYIINLSKADDAEKQGDVKKAQTLRRAANAEIRDVEMQSDYSYFNEDEDKAELGKEMFNPASYGFVLDRHAPIRRAKFIYLMTQLYHIAPNVVIDFATEYGMEISPHSVK